MNGRENRTQTASTLMRTDYQLHYTRPVNNNKRTKQDTGNYGNY